MPARPALASLLGLVILSCAPLAPAPPWLAAESEQELREGQTPKDDGRGYQSDSVDSLRGRALRAASWVKHRLSGFHVTPARLLIGLGALGVLFTWNKNKKKGGWAALTGLAWLMLATGAAAIVFGWRALS